jgi:hypothetical protein
MTARLQKRLALGAALVAVAVVLAANARLVALAIGSQPACVATDAAPAKRAC